jgi:hypothetical protein
MKGTITNEFRTICEVHREIYDICYIVLKENEPAIFDKLTVLLNEAFDMGVRMDAKLKACKKESEGVDVPNTDKDKIAAVRKIRVDDERILH